MPVASITFAQRCCLFAACIVGLISGDSSAEVYRRRAESGEHELQVVNGEVQHQIKRTGVGDTFQSVNDECEDPLTGIVQVAAAEGYHQGGIGLFTGALWIGGNAGPMHVLALTKSGEVWYAVRHDSGKWNGWRNLSRELQLPRIATIRGAGWAFKSPTPAFGINDKAGKEHTIALEEYHSKWVLDKFTLPDDKHDPVVFPVWEYVYRIEAFSREGVVVATREVTAKIVERPLSNPDAEAQNGVAVTQTFWAPGVEYQSKRATLVRKTKVPAN